jgi:hypothetical protein
MFLATALFYYLSIPLSSFVIAASSTVGMLASYLTVAIVAFLLGSIFPVLCHYGIRSDTSVGLSLSGIYMANILGSTAGPLVTGFVLMNYLTMEQIILYLSALSLVMAAGVGLLGAQGFKTKVVLLGGVLLMLPALFVLQDATYGQLLARFLYRQDSIGELLRRDGYKYVVQNRSGIISVIRQDKGGDIIFGGGVYDGRFNVDPVGDSNGIRRAYMMAALHPNPEEILEIGLSSGSFTWAVAAHAGVKKVIVLEINPGYVELIKKYPDHRAILSDPKSRYYFDDGRRWLKRHPEVKFDFILMNTTYHWRSNITNLLSREFLEMCRGHLKDGGVIYYNTTGSEDILITAANVFKYVTTYGNFVAASDRPFAMTEEERRQNLLKFHVDGRIIFDDGNSAMRPVLEGMLASDLRDRGEEIRLRADLRVITEDNMLTEFKAMHHGTARFYRWYDPGKAWTNFYF